MSHVLSRNMNVKFSEDLVNTINNEIRVTLLSSHWELHTWNKQESSILSRANGLEMTEQKHH